MIIVTSFHLIFDYTQLDRVSLSAKNPKGKTMLKHILVPLDQSSLAENALEHLPELVSSETRVTLLAVIVPPDLSPGTWYTDDPVEIMPEAGDMYEGLARQMVVQAEAYLRQISDRLNESGIKTDILVQTGKADATIVSTATDLDINAIVMATHGRSGLSRWLLGSVTQKVLSAAPCPVYVIPAQSSTA